MLVSVVVPTFNGEEYVVEAVESACAQTHRDIEVLVVDDGSTDGTVDAVRGVDDPRVRLIRRPNGGVAAARNTGVQAAAGQFLAFLDQDDAWAPDKLAAQLPRFDEPDVAVVGSLMTYVGPSGRPVGTSGEIADHQQQRIAEVRLMPFPPSSMVVRAAVLAEIGGFDEELVRRVAPIDDIEFLSRVARRYRIVTVPRSLGRFRVHAGAGSFAGFHAMRRGTRFLQARVADPGLSWETWDATARDGLALRRRERGKFLYRAAGLRLASGDAAGGLATLAAAVALAPTYSIPRLRRQRRLAPSRRE